MRKSILFVLHDAERMGAPMVMLHFIRWIKQHTGVRVTMLFKAGGSLFSDFRELGPSYIWRPAQTSTSLRIRVRNAVRRRIGRNDLHIPYPSELTRAKFDIVYLNTADCIPLAPMLKQRYQCELFAHIHELSYSIQAYFPGAFQIESIRAIDHYIAASDVVKKNLISKHQIPDNAITVFNEFIPVDQIISPTVPAVTIRQELGLTGQFVVGAAGQAGWRKGTDVFIQIAALVSKLYPENNISFLWIGHQSFEVHAQTAYEIDKLGLKGKVIFTGSKEQPQNYYQIFDLFLLTSREDPFPLVVLEAAALKKAIFCFEDTGGIPEIVTPETGAKVAYGDINNMARAITAAAKNRKHLHKLGENAYTLARQFDVDVIAPKLFEFIIDC